MLTEFAVRYRTKTGKRFNVKKRHIRYILKIIFIIPLRNLKIFFRCLAHIINLATQALIATRSKAKYYNPHDKDQDTPNLDGDEGFERDEVGLVRLICVKVQVLQVTTFCNLSITLLIGSFIITTERTLQNITG